MAKRMQRDCLAQPRGFGGLLERKRLFYCTGVRPREAAASCDAEPQRDHRISLIDPERSNVSRCRSQLAGVFERCS